MSPTCLATGAIIVGGHKARGLAAAVACKRGLAEALPQQKAFKPFKPILHGAQCPALSAEPQPELWRGTHPFLHICERQRLPTGELPLSWDTDLSTNSRNLSGGPNHQRWSLKKGLPWDNQIEGDKCINTRGLNATWEILKKFIMGLTPAGTQGFWVVLVIECPQRNVPLSGVW